MAAKKTSSKSKSKSKSKAKSTSAASAVTQDDLKKLTEELSNVRELVEVTSSDVAGLCEHLGMVLADDAEDDGEEPDEEDEDDDDDEEDEDDD